MQASRSCLACSLPMSPPAAKTPGLSLKDERSLARRALQIGQPDWLTADAQRSHAYHRVRRDSSSSLDHSR